MTRKTKNILLIIVLIAAFLLLKFCIIGSCFVLFIGAGYDDNYEITSDPSGYADVIVGEKWGLSEKIFPQSLDGLEVSEFKHVYYNPWDANYLAYLVVDYSEEAYRQEVSRLHEYGIKKYLGYYSVTGFTDYKLLAMEADEYNGFVYAITDGESKIIYVELIFCNYFMDIDYEKEIPNEYLPDGFNAKSDNPYQKAMQ